MAKHTLTVKQIDAYPGYGTLRDGEGLMLRNGRWVLRIQVASRRRDIGLGGLAVVGLKEARRKADEARERARRGIVLLSSMTFEQAWQEFWKDKKQTLSNGKHVWQWKQTMAAHVLPVIGKRAVADIRPPEIIAALRPIWEVTPETARRTLDRVRVVFTWAIVNEVRERGNPCEGVAKLLGGKREPARHFRAMPYSDLPAFMVQLRRMRPTPARLCLQFVILTACRSAEARHASWEEILEDATGESDEAQGQIQSTQWAIPPERTKMRRLHMVPLSDAAKAVLVLARLLRRPPDCSLIFPLSNGEALSDMAMTKLLRDMGVADHAVVHGFRSTFRDWATEKAKAREVVAEACLAHAVRDKTEKAYRRATYFDERAQLMAEWAAYL